MYIRKNRFGTALILTPEEQDYQYAQNLKDILENTRWFLDNLEYFPVYYHRNVDYHTGNGRPRWKAQRTLSATIIYKGVNKSFNSTGWMYNGDSQAVNLNKRD